MNQEIERRFLVDIHHFSFQDKKKSIKQAYLFFDSNQVFRIRKIGTEYLIAYKFKKTNIHRLEFEYPISKEDGEALFQLSKYYIIEKDRYYHKINNQLWEVDVFHGHNEGLVIAEAELKSEDEYLDIPNWINKEISNEEKYLNYNLSKKPYTYWSIK